MQIYVACLASYNAGVLHGEWIDLEGRDADDVRDEIARILRESPHPNVTVDCPDCGGTGTTYVPEYSAGRNARRVAEAARSPAPRSGPSTTTTTCSGIPGASTPT